MRRFVIIGQRAKASPNVRLDDLPSTSGRLDVLVRCLRAALLISHGLRKDTVVYLVLGGGDEGSRTIRIEGTEAQFLRPDERSLAILLQKALARFAESEREQASEGFRAVKAGISVAKGGLESVLGDLEEARLFVLELGGKDLREALQEGLSRAQNIVFFVGDHLGFEEAMRKRLEVAGAVALSVGPRCIHAEDVIAIVHNEVDRAEGC